MNKNNRWFTLVELIISLTIIAIITTIAYLHFSEKNWKYIFSSWFSISEKSMTRKIEWNEECYRFLMAPQDGRGYIYPNTHKVNPKDIWEYYNCWENENFLNNLNRFNYKNYWVKTTENLFIGKEAIDDLCYTFYYKKTPLIDIIWLDCTKQYIYAFQKGHLTIDDDENESKEKRTQILNNRIKNKEDLEIIEKINQKFNQK